MFPATIAVALITGFQVSTTIFTSGPATLCFYHDIRKENTSLLRFIICLSYGDFGHGGFQGTGDIVIAAFQSTGILPTQRSSMHSSELSCQASFPWRRPLVRFSGREAVETSLPPTITGSISMIIGLALAGNALTDAAPSTAQGAAGITTTSWVWVVSLYYAAFDNSLF